MRTTHRRPARLTALTLAGAALVATLGACAGGAAAAPEPRAPQPASTVGLTREDVDAWLDDTLPAALDEARVAGATIAVVHDGEVLTARGFGLADVAAGTPVDGDRTLFRTGSVSKIVTATAVMQLVEDGRVDLDTDVEQYTGLDLGHRHPVTLRHLLTHTAGYEERLAGLLGAPGTTPDLRASLVTDPPEQVYEPGTTPAYSNYGNALAGYVVEAVSGQPFEEYVAEHVLEPLGMTSASYAQPLPADLAARVSQGYTSSDGPPTGFETVGQPPAGSLSATAADMAQLMLAHLEGSPVLSDATVELMQLPALDEDSLGALAAGSRMGLGWFDESSGGHRAVGHGGDTNAFHSHLRLWPDEGTGLFLSLNSAGADKAAYRLRDELLAGFSDRYLPADGPVTSGVDDATRAEHARALAGPYESTRGFRSTFLRAPALAQPLRLQVVDGDRVLVPAGVAAMEPIVIEEVEPWVFQQVDGPHRFAVRTDDAGNVELVGHDGAMSLAPVGTAQQAVVPAFAGGVSALLLSLLAVPVAAVVRKVRARRTPDAATSPAPASVRLPRLLTRAAAASTVLAVAGWVYVVLSIMQLADAPVLLVRAVQALTAVGVLGLLPAVWRLVAEARAGTGRLRLAGAGVLVAAFAAVAWSANELLLTSPDITY